MDIKGQLVLEKRMYDDGCAAWLAAQKRNVDGGSASETAWNRRLTKVLITPLAEGITAYLESLKGKRGKRSKGAHILQVVDPYAAAYISLKTALDMLSSGLATSEKGITLPVLSRALGSRIEDNIRFTKLEEAAPNYVARVNESLKRAFSQKYQHRVASMAAAERRLVEGAKSGTQQFAFDVKEWVHWAADDQIQVGLLILDIIDRCLTIEGDPFIEISMESKGGVRWTRVSLSAKAVQWCTEYSDEVQGMFPQFAPCIIPPRPWTGPFSGGYYSEELSAHLPMVKSGRMQHRKSLTYKRMPKVYDALNYIQAIPWAVNTQLLQAADEVFSSALVGSAVPSRVPYVTPTSPVPAEYQGLKGKDLMAVLSPEQQERFLAWKAEARDLYTAERIRRAKVLKFGSILCQAREYARYPEIYFVWNLDSRGRVYCNSARMSPQGEDIGKAMLRFAHGDKLGEHGRKWLAVQGMGVWAEAVPNSNKKGDKISIPERVQAVELMQDMILDCAADPVAFTEWMQADKPWQFLAWCQEWERLIAWEEAGNRTEDFISYLPVALDGSCSGIQHYSAMLRDPMGGKYVNLTPEQEQQDIYGEVAKRVIAQLKRISKGEWVCSAASLEGADQMRIAQDWLQYGISRGFTKRPVMTLPYGSSNRTARDNVVEILEGEEAKARDNSRRSGVPYICPHAFDTRASDLDKKEYSRQGINLVTNVMWGEIGTVVPAARQAMKFIKSIAHKVAEGNSALRWTTPTGFVVEQCIWQREERHIDTALLGRTTIAIDVDTRVIDVAAMKGAAAPNFVHSYDASHLMLHCLELKAAKIDKVALIHDSFGCTAGSTEVASKLLRKSFIEMYESCDPLHQFMQDAEEASSIPLELDVPQKGTLDLSQMYQSQYSFI